MTLQNYIIEVGQSELARQLNVTRQTVFQWLNFSTVPRPEMAGRIIAISKNRVTWEDIYKPYAIANGKKY